MSQVAQNLSKSHYGPAPIDLLQFVFTSLEPEVLEHNFDDTFNGNPLNFLVWTQKKGVFLFPHHSLLCADQLLFCWRKHVSFLCFLLWVIYVYFIYIFFNPFYVFSMMYYLWLYYIHFKFLKWQVRQEFLPSLVCSVYYDTFAGWVKILSLSLSFIRRTYNVPFLTIFIYCILIKLK